MNYDSFGYALAMRVLQSDLYHKLDETERAECDEMLRRCSSSSKEQSNAAGQDDKELPGSADGVRPSQLSPVPAAPSSCSEKEQPAAIYVWLVPSEQVLEQPGSWRIRKWDTEPFPEANYALSARAAVIEECRRIVIEEGPRAYPNIDRIVRRLDTLASIDGTRK